MEMDDLESALDELTAAFRRSLSMAVEAMRQSRTPSAFCESERRLVELAQGLSSEVTQRVVQALLEDGSVRKAALEEVRERASDAAVQMRVERDREVEIQTLGGKNVVVKASYATATPRGAARVGRGAQGTGVYPVLDLLGIVARSTPALRLCVAHAVSEANSVTSARALLAGSGVEVDHKEALRWTYGVAEDALLGRAEGIRTTLESARTGPLAGRRVVAAVDGGRINVRRRVPGRPKKGGRRRFVTEWREPKVVTIYVVGPDGKRDRTIPPVLDGTMGDADAAFPMRRWCGEVPRRPW